MLFLLALFGSVGLVLGYSLFVGPEARKKWNEKLRARVAEAARQDPPSTLACSVA